MKLVSVTALIMSLAIVGCASTETTGNTQSSKSGVPDKIVLGSADDEYRCVYTAATGSNFKKKICKTNAEWNAMRENAQRKTNAIQRKGGTHNPSGG